MRSVYALRRLLSQLSLGACTFLLSCKGCWQKDSQTNTEPSSCAEQSEPVKQLGPFIKTTCGSKDDNPAIQAFYTEQSVAKEFFLADIFSSDSNHFECAPGPYLANNDSEIDDPKKRWSLQGMPKYFFLQFNNTNNFTHENFYIANANGFPISCQSFKLKQQDNTTLVLLPKSKLEAGKSYYLYLIQQTGETRHTWIQPLMLNEDV